MSSSRSKPFSGKQKKKQLALKRQKKNQTSEGIIPIEPPKPKAVEQRRNKLVSQFDKDDSATIELRREAAMKPLQRLSKESLEISFEEMYPEMLSIPTRPNWSFKMSKEELERNEQEYFKTWQDNLYQKYKREDLSYFEKNLEVWRQLWRVVEISDVILLIVDIRNPVLHFNPSFYNWIVEKNRKIVVVLMKVDLVSNYVVESWINYLKSKFPLLSFVPFSIYASDKFVNQNENEKQKSVRRKRYVDSAGVVELLKTLESLNIRKPGIDSDWNTIMQKHNIEFTHSDKVNNSIPDETLSEDYLTIGLVGHPNVGKSSLINGIIGKKVVSSSRSPGHTKHFQTIHLSPKIRLCDCPGLVFPSFVSKPVQITSGIYPIAQVRDPYYSLVFVAERISLESILNLKLPEEYKEWSAWSICEAFAIDRGFYTAKGARPDVYRAANMILRLIVDGRILVSWKPPGYFAHQNEQIEEAAIDTAYISSEEESEKESEEEDSSTTEDLEELNSFSVLDIS